MGKDPSCPIKDIDFTDHGRPKIHTNPHQHPYTKTPGGPSVDLHSHWVNNKYTEAKMIQPIVMTPDILLAFTNENGPICSGAQAAKIMALVENLTGPLAWFVNDLDCTSPQCPELINIMQIQTPTCIGSGNEAINRVQMVWQFLSGVLAGVETFCHKDYCPQVSNTEDMPLALLSSILIEIHLLDTTQIEIYCANESLYRNIVSAIELK